MDEITTTEKEEMVNRILMWMIYNVENKPGSFIKRWCMRNKRDKKILKSLKTEDFNHRLK